MKRRKFAVVDVETTGLDSHVDRIIEIGIIHLDSRLVETDAWHSLINPGSGVGATHIHGLRNSDLVDAPNFLDVSNEVINRLEGRLIVAHNFRFDRSFLNAEFARSQRAERLPTTCGVCTMDQSRIYCPDGSHSLVGLAQRLDIRVSGLHRAVSDARMSAELLRRYFSLEKAGKRVLQRAVNRQGAVVFPEQWRTSTPVTWNSAGVLPAEFEC